MTGCDRRVTPHLSVLGLVLQDRLCVFNKLRRRCDLPFGQTDRHLHSRINDLQNVGPLSTLKWGVTDRRLTGRK